MRFVPIKTDDQLDLQALHRVRERLVSRRTAVINQVRAFLLERGIVFRKGPATLRREMPSILENDDHQFSGRMRRLLALLWHEWKELEEQIATLSGEIETICESDAACQRLRQIPGIGPLVASATVGAIGNGAAFRRGATLQPGWGWCRDSTRPAARPDCSASASGAIPTCGKCSSTAAAP